MAGCYHPDVASGVPCGAGDACPTGLACENGVCVPPGGSTDAAPPDIAIDACPQAQCENATTLLDCDGSRVTCSNGCDETNGAHCRQLVPSNGIPIALLGGATANITGNWTFNTETGEIRKGNMILRQAGTGVIAGISFQVIDGMGVFAANRWDVPVNVDWDANGTNTWVLFAATTINVSGTIDAGASGEVGGPGGSNATTSMSGTACRGRAGRYFLAGFGEGGGGGGGRDGGGDGAPSNMDTGNATGAGGTQCSTRATTIPLRGGAGGGAGAASSLNPGGGGGGAIALVAMESVTVSGAVGAPGGGGASAATGTSPGGDAGGGGGGGGAVFLEAPIVTITGALTANGGSGASPSSVDGARGSLTTASAAAGGSFSGPGGTRNGGRGGAGSLTPGNGQTYTYDDGLGTPTSIVSRGAGGGGSAGRVQIKATTRTTTGSVLSPAASVSDAVYQ